jgi:hypothetical protein
VQVQSAQGVVGNNSADWSYTAVETANNLTLTSPDGVTSVNGTVTFSMSYDAATGATTTTASAPTVTLAITHTASSGNVSGTITITALAYSRLHGVDPSSDTLSSSGAISVQASDAVISFGVTTPTAVTISNGNLEGGVIQLTDDGAVETITASGASSVNVVVTVGTQTGTYSENVDSLEQLTGS